MQNNLTTNIIAGIYKNKKISLPSLESTRSSKKILRESFFNTMQYDIVDQIFVEAFAGSGSMGIEALSRGASEAVFFEKDTEAFTVLEGNISSLAIANAQCFRGDTFVIFLNKITSLQDAILYFDPPFSIREGMDEIYKNTLTLIAKIKKDQAQLICIEHLSTVTLPENITHFAQYKSKKFGKSTLTYYN